MLLWTQCLAEGRRSRQRAFRKILRHRDRDSLSGRRHRREFATIVKKGDSVGASRLEIKRTVVVRHHRLGGSPHWLAAPFNYAKRVPEIPIQIAAISNGAESVATSDISSGKLIQTDEWNIPTSPSTGATAIAADPSRSFIHVRDKQAQHSVCTPNLFHR